MVIIDIQFSRAGGKTYKYLLVNPKGLKIDKEKPLVEEMGASMTGIYGRELYPIAVHKVDSLPAIVTSQIVLLEGNRIFIQKIGGSAHLPFDEETPDVSKSDKAAPEIKKISKKPSTKYISLANELKKRNEAAKRIKMNAYIRALASGNKKLL